MLNIPETLLNPGDRMPLSEFLERWERLPELKFAELIDGVVYTPSTISIEHGAMTSRIVGWLSDYAHRTKGSQVLSNATTLMQGSAPQPDLSLRILPEAGVQGELLSGAPELVVELCVSSRSYDLGPKLPLYQRAGVGEFIAVLIEERQIEWRSAFDGIYQMMAADSDGIFRSRIFPGLWLDAQALFQDDWAALRSTLNVGMDSPEYVVFADKLRRALAGE